MRIVLSHPFKGDVQKNIQSAMEYATLIKTIYPTATVFIPHTMISNLNDDIRAERELALAMCLGAIEKWATHVCFCGEYHQSEGCRQEFIAAQIYQKQILYGEDLETRRVPKYEDDKATL